MQLIISKYKDIHMKFLKYSFLEKIQMFFLFIFVSSITLDQKINSFFLFLFLFSLIFSFKIESLKNNFLQVLIFSSSYIFSILSLFYSEDIEEGKLILERQLVLMFLPLIGLTCFKMNKEKFNLILKLFFISIVIVSLYLLKVFFEKLYDSHLLFKELFIKDNLYHAFAKPIGMHAIYLSLYFGIGIFVGFYLLLLNYKLWVKFIIFICSLILVITLTLLASRVVISSTLILLILVYPFYIKKLKLKFLFIIASAIIFFVSFFLVRESSFISGKFLEKINDEFKLKPFLNADTTYNPIYGGEARADRWFCAVELIKDKPFFGYGTGSEKDVLMLKYKKYNLQNAIINNYDSHNQYLAFCIKSGLFGLLFFLISIFYALYIAIKSKNLLYQAFILLFALTCMTENLLESNKGIFFFSFFNVLFFLNSISLTEIKKDEIKKGVTI